MLRRNLHHGVRRHWNGSYTVTFPNTRAVRTTVTDSAYIVFEWIIENWEIRHQGPSDLVVGLAIRRRPVLPSSTDRRSIALLQLCVADQCLIFQILRADSIPYRLHLFLRSESCRFVGVGMTALADQLGDEYGLVVRNAVDLQELAAERMARADLRRARLQVLAQELIGLNVNMKRSTSAWDQRQLACVQIAIACADAFMACEVGTWLLSPRSSG